MVSMIFQQQLSLRNLKIAFHCLCSLLLLPRISEHFSIVRNNKILTKYKIIKVIASAPEKKTLLCMIIYKVEYLSHAAILEKFKGFFSKKPIYFSKKIPNFERFENSYYSSRILRQIHYNLVKKKISRSETWTNIVLVWTQLANIG